MRAVVGGRYPLIVLIQVLRHSLYILSSSHELFITLTPSLFCIFASTCLISSIGKPYTTPKHCTRLPKMSPSPPGSSLLHLCRPVQLETSSGLSGSAGRGTDSECCEFARLPTPSPNSYAQASPTFMKFQRSPAPPTTEVDTQTCRVQRPYPLRRATSDITHHTSSTNTSIASSSLEHIACHAGIRMADSSILMAKPREQWQVSRTVVGA